VLRQLHWLLVRQRITFKSAMITYKCLYGMAPSYLADVCIHVSSVISRWQLPLADSGTRTMISGRDCCVGPGGMEQPPVELRTSPVSVETFAQKLKSHLFGC